MIAALSPSLDSFEETLSTLKYADRAKSIKTKPIINEDPKDIMLREMETEIKQLREMLAAMQGKGMSQSDMTNAIKHMSTHIKENGGSHHVEESVDDLLKKLEGQGKKVKIIESDDEDEDSDKPPPPPDNKMLEKLLELEELQNERQHIETDK